MYKHTQFGFLTVVSVGCAIALLVLITANTGWHAVSVGVLAVLVVVLFLFYSLTVTVDTHEVRCSFGPGLISRRFGLSEIVGAVQVRNRWYYGWGIRLTPSGWMFNVSGLDAVELELVSGTRFRIGTDEPDALVRAIEQGKGISG